MPFRGKNLIDEFQSTASILLAIFSKLEVYPPEAAPQATRAWVTLSGYLFFAILISFSVKPYILSTKISKYRKHPACDLLQAFFVPHAMPSNSGGIHPVHPVRSCFMSPKTYPSRF